MARNEQQKAIIDGFLNQSRLVFGAKNLQGQYLYVNEEYVKLFGFDREEFIGKTDHELFPEEVASAFREADLKVIRSRQKTMFEELAEVDDEQRTYLSIKFPIFGPDEVMIGVGLVATDVSKANNLNLSLERHHKALLEEAKHRQYVNVIQNAVANSCLLSIVTINEKGTVKSFNRTASTVFGYDEQEVIGQSINILVPEAIRPNHYSYIQSYFKAPESSSFGRGRVVNGRHKNGRLIPFEVDLLILQFDDEANVTILLYDMTEQVRITDELKASEQRFNRSHRIADIGTWEWNIKTGELYWSDNVYALVGAKPGQVPPGFELFRQKIHVEDVSAVEQAINNALHHDVPYYVEHRYMHPEKGDIWLLERGEVIRDKHGEPVTMIGVVEEITTRKVIEIQKNSLLQNHENLISALGEMTYEHYVPEQKILWSGAYQKILGYSAREMGDDDPSWLTRVHPDDLASVLAEFDRAKSQDLAFDVTYRFRAKDGSYLWFHDRGIMNLDDEGNLITNIGVMKNVTDRVRAEQERERKHAILKSVTKVQNSHLAQGDYKQVFELLLNELIKLTDSEYGFLGEILDVDSHAPYLKVHAITDISWDDASRALYQKSQENAMEFRNLNTLFGATIRSGEVVISNDPGTDSRSGGLAPGHPPLNRYLGLPVYYGEQLVGMLGIANRPKGYDQSIIDEIEPILNTGANLIVAQRNDLHRIRTDAALRESERKFRMVFNSSHDAILVADDKGFFVDCNQAALSLFGYEDRDSFILKHIVDVTPDLVFGKNKELLIQKHLKKALENGYERLEWVHQNTRGESIPCDVTLSSLELDGSTYIQAIVRDNREKQKALEKQQALQKQLAQTQKMESIGQLTGGVAHDFNNILAAIMGFAELTRFSISEDDNKTQGYIDQIMNSGRRAKSLVQQMLAFSRGELGQPQCLLPALCVQEAIELLRPTIPSSIHISLNVNDEDVEVFLDRTQLHQMIMNLVINSRDAMKDEKGKINIALRVHAKMQQVCDSCHETFEGGYVEITVSDNGCGIPAECLSRIFEPFYTTKLLGKGTGMGLSVVHGIVHGNSGHIAVRSSLSTGTRVTLYFPVLEQAIGVAETEVENSAVQANAQSRKVLVVDDEVAVTTYMSELLTTNNYEVTAVNSSKTALELFQSNPDVYEIVISDQTMPELTGAELASELLQQHPELPIILCSGYSATIDEKAAHEIGIKAYMEKPVDSAKLLNTIRELL